MALSSVVAIVACVWLWIVCQNKRALEVANDELIVERDHWLKEYDAMMRMNVSYKNCIEQERRRAVEAERKVAALQELREKMDDYWRSKVQQLSGRLGSVTAKYNKLAKDKS